LPYRKRRMGMRPFDISLGTNDYGVAFINHSLNSN